MDTSRSKPSLIPSVADPGVTRSSNRKKKIKYSLYWRYYTLKRVPGPSPRLSAWATQLRRIVTAAGSCWRQRVRFDFNRTP